MSCPICGSAATEHAWTAHDRLFRTTEERFAMQRCPACGVLFLTPPPVGRLSRYYPETYWAGPAERAGASLRHGLAERYRRAVLRDHVRFVGRVVAEQRRRGTVVRLLDVGCGDGSVLAALNVAGAVGLDGSAPAVRAARARGFDAVRGLVTALPFRTGSFSVVTMFHVLEHVANPAPALGAAHALLAPGGDLVVQVPDAASWQAAWLGPRWSGFDVPRHLINYPPAALRRVLEGNGFEVIRETRASLRDDLALLASSLAPGLYPPARAARPARGGGASWLRDLGYLTVTLAVSPLVLLAAACGRGATVTVQARRRERPGAA